MALTPNIKNQIKVTDIFYSTYLFMKEKLRITVVLSMLVLLFAVASRQDRLSKELLVYADSLDVVAVTVDEVELTLRDIAVYVAYQ